MLTTHTGSLPRPPALAEKLVARDRGLLGPEDAAALDADIVAAVAAAVTAQREAGIAIVNDGEMGKIGYSTYVRERLTSFDGESRAWSPPVDLADHPALARRIMGEIDVVIPACTGPIAYRGTTQLTFDLTTLGAQLDGSPGFMSAVSPGTIAMSFADDHYRDPVAFVDAIADAMRIEYEAIAAAGLLLQLDCPDLAMGRHTAFAGLTDAAFRERLELHVDALNRAVAGIPPERMRMHVCWGNYAGPHHHDVPLREIVDVVLTARPATLLFESANPRHQHEWRVFADVRLPDEKILVPGVIDTSTNYVEHPELVAQRLDRYARIVGADRVIAGTDCGFATLATFTTVDPDIAWRKLRSLVEGAGLASRTGL